MTLKIEYQDEKDREAILEEYAHLYFIEDQNIYEGNFLVFTDVKPIEIEINELKQENIMNMIAMTEMYENNVQMEQENTNTMVAVTELYEMLLGGD